RRITHVTSGNPSARLKLQPNEHVATKGLGNGHTLAVFTHCRNVCLHLAFRQRGEPTPEHGNACLDFTDAHPNASVDIACGETGHLERRVGIGLVSKIAAGVEAAAGRASDVSSGRPSRHELKRYNAGRTGAVL